MIILFFILHAINDNHIEILESTESMMKLHVEFYEANRTEPLPITRFILSEDEPKYSYRVYENGHSIIDKNPNTIQIGDPIKIKRCNLYPVVIYPYYESLEIELSYTPTQSNLDIAPSLKNVFKNLILNFKDNGHAKPMGYLIITPNSFYDAVLPLARWKELKGWKVWVKTLSETGSLAAEIKNYISNAYHTWSPRPEYVLLIGNIDSLPAFFVPGEPNPTDHPYTTVEGNDFLSDVLIGRISVQNVNELNTVVAKILGYEKDPYVAETDWFTRGLMVAANHPAYMTTPIPVKRWVREKMLNHGFAQVDSVYYPPTLNGQIPITNAVNQGVTFVNYRGGIAGDYRWTHPTFNVDDVNALLNGWKLPVVTSIVCNTGNFNALACFGEVWLRVGSPMNPKGAVAFFGASSPNTHTRWNNCLDYGIYWGFLEENIYNLGPMMYRGKMEIYLNFPLQTSLDTVEFYFNTYNLLGDPSLEVWTNPPDSFIVNHLSVASVGTNSFIVQVLNALSQPVENAMVSLYKENEVKEIEFTDASGNADFSFSISSAETLFITVTKHNFKPYCGYCLINNSSVYVGYYSHNVSDPSGNNNGEVNPGEAIELSVMLKNYGTSILANNVTTKLTTNDPLVTIIDSIKSYGNIAPADTASASPYIFNLSTNVKNNHKLKFNLEITSSQGNWNSNVWIIVKAPDFVYQRNHILDGNGVLEPGETADLIISIKNMGGLNGSNISGILRSFNNGLVVTDSFGSFGNIAVGDSSTNSTNHFTLSAASSITPGNLINFALLLSGDNSFEDTVGFQVMIGIVDSTHPLGPDDYGYYAYDDTDTNYSECPTYDWIEIDPGLGGSGNILNLGNDETTTINLPFNFKFYGNWYNKISICSNGYVAMDSTWIADMYNWRIPAAGGPPLLIAPFWDDLDPSATDSSRDICHWYDATNHRFVVEYSRIQHIHDPTNPTPAELQTFEVVLFDPQYYPTLTGDGEIIFQYKNITNDDVWHNYATVGIENFDHTGGLEFTYANIYSSAAALLRNDRAIKFTTDPPDTFTVVKESNVFDITSVMLSVSPNPFRNSTNIIFNTDYVAGVLDLKIFDVTGRLIRKFLLSAIDHAQPTVFSWDGTDEFGDKVPKGIYFVQLQGINDFNIIKKIVFIN